MTETTKQIIQATAPIVKEQGAAITTRMYERLFSAHPELEVLFKDAADDQYKKLANAIYAYASNIDKLDQLSKGIDTMVASHVRTRVQPEHYPMVGTALLGAMQDILGDSANEEVIDAWKEAYFFLADILIAKEQKQMNV